MKKITVKICSGTTCFVMGGNYMSDAAEMIEEKYGDKVTVIGSPCLNKCSETHSKAPYAIIDDEVISEVTPEKLIMELEKRFESNE
ncbi:MAG: NAD(P)H-dependent oxidoreductase subunit E [Candidatus Gastranaerophilales bacterium]|nr:NAD(P)H-dependent oxidoreductase subunit E [Candidatus Gastranaerophilales bacterium]